MSTTGRRGHRAGAATPSDGDALLSAAAHALYERLLRRGTSPVAASDRAAAAELISTGLAVQLSESSHLSPIAPIAGLNRRLADAAEDAARGHRDLAAAYEEASRLQQLYIQSQLGWELSSHLTVLRGDAVAATATALIQDARTELLHLNTGHYRRPPTNDTLVEPDKAAMAAGTLRVRCVYAESFVRLPDGEQFIRDCQRAGEEIRVSNEVPMKLYLADADIALVPLLLESENAALLLRGTDLVLALRVFFELLWMRATPWPGTDQSTDEPLSPVQRRILELLAAGFSDDRVALTLGVSTRTVRRHVAVIMERLDTSTRFAAAIAARRLGWL